MEVRIKNGELEQILTRTFLTIDGVDTIAEVDDPEEEPFTITFRFVADEEDTSTRLQAGAHPEYMSNPFGRAHLLVTLTNWKHALGGGTQHPMPVGTHRGRALSMSIFARMIGSVNEARAVTFALFLSPAAEEGVSKAGVDSTTATSRTDL